ncbi:MFS transporter [Kocuria marina]|uniref:MFS transporter n=1 Tax=Kocuria marina TaxID=223184 RepID=UPI0022E29E9A|nr:MFS transporter [Kocuria marina]
MNTSGVDRASVGLRSQRGPVLLAVMLSTALVALDATILATAVPSIVGSLGNFAQFPWLFSSYMLAQAVSVPIFSKLSDMYGRKPVILTGVGLFLVSSVLAGCAWSMTSLIVFRVIQGLGAGAVAPMGMTIVGDIYTVAERAAVQGYVAGVWAVSSVVGPTLGGLLSQFLSWRWVFFVNIPVALVAGWLLLRSYHEKIEREEHRVDFTGAAVLAIALSALILGALEGGNAWGWLSVPTLVCGVVGVVGLAIFVAVERRASEPIIDLALLRRRVVASTTLVSLGIGALLVGMTSYVPTYLERTAGATPIAAGAAVAAVSIGWPVAASTAGRIYMRWGFRRTVLLGGAIAIVGAALTAALSPWPSVIGMAVCAFIIGLGLGYTAAPSLIMAQSSVEWNQRGSVTGLNMFARSAGSAVGVAIYGAIATNLIRAGGGEGDPATVIHASGWVFVAAAVTAVLMAAATLAIPRDEPGSVK